MIKKKKKNQTRKNFKYNSLLSPKNRTSPSDTETPPKSFQDGDTPKLLYGGLLDAVPTNQLFPPPVHTFGLHL